MAQPPPLKLRWGRVIFALLVLAGGIAAAIYYATK
jgi:hypothetical protein